MIEIIAIVLLLLLLNCLLVQVLYYLFILTKLAFYKSDNRNQTDLQPLSLIIAARNEYDNLEKHLSQILEQDHPNYEVVVVNDCSWDQTGTLLERLQTQYPHLKIVTLHEQEKYPKGKKFALTMGIKAASNELLVFTDADCRPTSKQWLRNMASNFTSGKELVLGYSPYRKVAGFLNLFIRFETFMTGVQYLSFALLRDAYMGVGRNLAYRRSLFFAVKGFGSHNHLLSGDDDLFVNEAATPSNVAIEVRKNSFMISEPKQTSAGWRKQKRRHLSTGKLYQPRHKFWLGLFNTTHILFHLLILASIILIPFMEPTKKHLISEMDFGYILVGVWLCRWLVQTSVLYPSMKKLNDITLIFLLPILDWIYSFYLFVFGIMSFFTKPKTWD
ncbi:MAG: glycosyltransferase [Flavobacteriaceae bacterium]|nr:glycosyltransferase [Flavobacteriaceae bacterium]